ncbi:copper-binding transcription factor [Tieghemiomyces parasiticus]|uniref:Copper-binding transcription factor n=1 Tax=Tieghemiomyces parasiticus TaxID=78921 RepID=A0A9W8DQ10_9FUNG|nr:copper-binding transcription factor [Tieghemiomyces parasiticus]
MPIIDGKKFACEKCIKGHRATNCTHTDRELIEIKRKGRPASQCATCRENRKLNNVHAKCECRALLQENKRRKVMPPPSVRASKSGIASLLNPCECSKSKMCVCCRPSFDRLYEKSSAQEERDTIRSLRDLAPGEGDHTTAQDLPLNTTGPSGISSSSELRRCCWITCLLDRQSLILNRKSETRRRVLTG